MALQSILFLYDKEKQFKEQKGNTMKKLILIALLGLMAITTPLICAKPQCGTKKHLSKIATQFKNKNIDGRNKMIARFLRVSSIANGILADRLLQSQNHNTDMILIKKLSWAIEKNFDCIRGKAFAEKLLRNLFSQETARPLEGMEENLNKMYEDMLLLLTNLAVAQKNNVRQDSKKASKDSE